ncbi:MAG: hypothetical protein OXU45_01875 [Candidatus Melainabacteria bacterium]|nr:hypothetical protein [Candidatus Melainabacteria bacterium]
MLRKDDAELRAQALAAREASLSEDDIGPELIRRFLDPEHKAKSLDLIREQLAAYAPIKGGHLRHGHSSRPGRPQNAPLSLHRNLVPLFLKLAMGHIKLDESSLKVRNGAFGTGQQHPIDLIAMPHGEFKEVMSHSVGVGARILLEPTTVMRRFLERQIDVAGGGGFATDAAENIYEAIKNFRYLAEALKSLPREELPYAPLGRPPRTHREVPAGREDAYNEVEPDWTLK